MLLVFVFFDFDALSLTSVAAARLGILVVGLRLDAAAFLFALFFLEGGARVLAICRLKELESFLGGSFVVDVCFLGGDLRSVDTVEK